MGDATERFTAAAAAHGIEVEVVEHPEGTRTAQDAAAAIGCELDQIVKSLVFVAVTRDGGRMPVLALTAGGNRVDTDALARSLGARVVEKADADEVRSATGYAIGGTPPFGHATRLPTVLDERLLDFDVVWAAAGTPSTVFRLRPYDLVAVGARVVGDFTA